MATATCDSVSGAVETRWKEDACRFSVDTYLDEFLVTSASTQRILCAAEREALLGFPKSHTRPILKQVGGQAGETARLNLVGRAPHCASVACILLLGLPAAGCQHELPSFQEVLDKRAYELSCWPSEKPPSHCHSNGRSPEVYDSVEDTEMRYKQVIQETGLLLSIQDHSVPLQRSETLLPRFFLRRAEYRGSDIRLDTGMLQHPERAPCSTINPHFWKWKTVQRWRWNHKDHIIVGIAGIPPNLEVASAVQTMFQNRILASFRQSSLFECPRERTQQLFQSQPHFAEDRRNCSCG